MLRYGGGEKKGGGERKIPGAAGQRSPFGFLLWRKVLQPDGVFPEEPSPEHTGMGRRLSEKKPGYKVIRYGRKACRAAFRLHPLRGRMWEQEGLRALRKQSAALSLSGACHPFFQQKKAPGKASTGSNAVPPVRHCSCNRRCNRGPGDADCMGGISGMEFEGE